MLKKYWAWITGVIILGVIVAAIAFIPKKSDGTEGWQDIRETIMPQFMLASHKDSNSVVYKPFSPQIDIGVVRDEEARYIFVRPVDVQEWGITEEELFDVAYENLEKLSKESDVQLQHSESGNGQYMIIDTTDGYAAVRILSEKVRNAAAKVLGERFLVGMPTRDFMILWGQDFPYSEEFAAQVKVEFEAETTYPLSPDLFLVMPDGIQPVQIAQ